LISHPHYRVGREGLGRSARIIEVHFYKKSMTTLDTMYYCATSLCMYIWTRAFIYLVTIREWNRAEIRAFVRVPRIENRTSVVYVN